MFHVLFAVVETGMEMVDFGKFNAIRSYSLLYRSSQPHSAGGG